MWMIILFDVDRDDKYSRLCLYLTLIMHIFALKVFPTINMCFNYWTSGFLFNYILLKFRYSRQYEDAEVRLEEV